MFRWQRFNLVLAAYGSLISVSAFITAWAIYQIPSDPRNIVFLGLSLQRLIMIGTVAFAGILAAILAVKLYRDDVWAERVRSSVFGGKILGLGIRWGAVAGFVSGWIAYFLPLYRWENHQDYYLRVAPLVVWAIFLSALTFVIAWVEKYGVHGSGLVNIFRAEKKTLTLALILFVVFLLVWVFIAVTGMGLWLSDGFWYGAGVPILGIQILFAFAIGIAVFFLERSYGRFLPAWSDILIFFLIWGLSAFFWAREPLPSSFFAPGPYLPDYQYHPFSDAATFDRGSQFALIGQGLNNGRYFDRALYMSFLIFLHKLAGQNYVQVVALQAAIYAVFPAILYLLGRAVNNRSFGVIISALIMMRGINGIAASTLVDLANQKQMLTDFPAVIFVALFALMAVQWLKSPNKNYLYALWAGGVIGLGIMLRTNVLFLLLFAGLLTGLIYWRQKLRGALIGILIVVAMFAGTFAWGAYNDKTIFDVYVYRILLVIRARYPQPVTPDAAPQGNETINMADTSLPVKTAMVVDLGARAKIKPVHVFVPIHFMHNMITSMLILPTSIELHDIWRTVRDVSPYWEPYWDGTFASSSARLFLTLNLFLVAMGIAVGWRFSRLAGLIPLGTFIFYNLANAFARTSGGRYIVPIDWIVLFYFALGLFQLILWGMSIFGLKSESDEAPPPQESWTWSPLKKAPFIIIFFLAVGALLPLSEQPFERRYPDRTQAELFTFLEQEGYIQKMGFDSADLQAASAQWPNFKVINGRALYPRYFAENKGLPKNRFPYSVMEFPRIAFTVIGPHGVNYVVLPQGSVPYFPNVSDVYVIGCQDGVNLDALAVVLIDQPPFVYVRQPESPLQCPLQQPVCDGDQGCGQP